MKRAGGLWTQIVDSRNLYEAAREAARGKRYAPSTLEFGFRREQELHALESKLRAEVWRPGPFCVFTIREPKRRLISAPSFRDRVVHHAILRVIEPFLDRRIVHRTFACRAAKGTHRAILECARLCRRFPFVLKCDLRKFFPSIDHEILKRTFRRLFKEAPLLAALDAVVDGSNPQESCAWYFPGDDLFAPFDRRRGLPIGALTSQWFANLYLNDLDQHVLRCLRPGGYVRYMDDFLLFDDSREGLGEARDGLVRFLERERLRLHEMKCLVLPVSRGVPFLGWRIFSDFRLLRCDNKVRARRRMRRLARDFRRGRVGVAEVRGSTMSWIGHVTWGDTWRLREEVIGRTTFRRRNGTGR